MYIVSSYFDFNDIDNPVHQYLQDSNLYNLMATLEQSVEYRGRLNQVIMNDNIFLGSQGSSDFREFYSINRALSSYTDPGTFNGYFRVLITLDQQIDQYQRSVFSFFDMFGFLGGIFGVFKL